MHLTTTPLQFGYFFSLAMAAILLVRGIRQSRLSDRLLAAIMWVLAMELQDYTFGFSGINVLWNEMNGFPRGVALLLGPLFFLYLKSQTNTNFRLEKKHLWHFFLWALVFFFELFFFVQGPYVVQEYQQSLAHSFINGSGRIFLWFSYIFYFTRCFKLYFQYRKWTETQFSDTEAISFTWFRNFIYGMIFWILCREVMNVLDRIYDWTFYQDWWWNLALVLVAFYVGLTGYAQKQPAHIDYAEGETPAPGEDVSPTETEATPIAQEENQKEELKVLAKRLNKVMTEERLFLQAEINLRDLSKHLKTNSSLLSATINQMFGQNFNDFVNKLRIEEFIKNYYEDSSRAYTMVTLAYDSGFNSKATFNRAFKKHKGCSPKEYFEQHPAPQVQKT